MTPETNTDRISGAPASKLARGCNIAVVVVFVGLAVGGFFAYQSTKDMTIDGANEPVKKVVVAKFATDYDQWKTAGKIPDAQARVFDDLVGITQRKDVSFWTTLLCYFTASSAIDESSLTDAKIKQLDDVAAYANENPGASIEDLGQFLQKHPEIQKTFTAEQKKHPETEIQ